MKSLIPLLLLLFAIGCDDLPKEHAEELRQEIKYQQEAQARENPETIRYTYHCALEQIARYELTGDEEARRQSIRLRDKVTDNEYFLDKYKDTVVKRFNRADEIRNP